MGLLSVDFEEVSAPIQFLPAQRKTKGPEGFSFWGVRPVQPRKHSSAF
jgi:hypothetical protein